MITCLKCGGDSDPQTGHRFCKDCGASIALTNPGRTSREQRRRAPNMQNIPIRTPEGERIRDLLPKPEIDLDYTGIEKEISEKMGEDLVVIYGSDRHKSRFYRGACSTCGCAPHECECGD